MQTEHMEISYHVWAARHLQIKGLLQSCQNNFTEFIMTTVYDICNVFDQESDS